MFLVGVTGGIGAGKSSVLEELAGLGARTVDADEVVHGLYNGNGCLVKQLVERWGCEILDADGRLNRKAVAKLVFGDSGEREWLNALIHPLVQAEIVRIAAAQAAPLICGIPLLYEVAWETRMDCVIAVWCDPDTQRRRLSLRGWSNAEIRQRCAAQLSMDEKLERSDFGIINRGSRFLLREQCSRVWAAITARAQAE